MTGAAIGAGAGAVVAGPVGAVAGGDRIYGHDKAGHWRWSE